MASSGGNPREDCRSGEGLSSAEVMVHGKKAPPNWLFIQLFASACFRLDAALRLFRQDALACLESSVEQGPFLPRDSQATLPEGLEAEALGRVQLRLSWSEARLRESTTPPFVESAWTRPPLFPVYLQLTTLSRGVVSEEVFRCLEDIGGSVGLVPLSILRHVALICGSSLFLLPYGGREDFGRAVWGGRGCLDGGSGVPLRIDFDSPVVSVFCGVCPGTVPEAEGSRLLWVLTCEKIDAFVLLPLEAGPSSATQRDSASTQHWNKTDALVVPVPQASGLGGASSSSSVVQLLPFSDLGTVLSSSLRQSLEKELQSEDRRSRIRGRVFPRRVIQRFAQVQIAAPRGEKNGGVTLHKPVLVCLGKGLFYFEILQGASRLQSLHAESAPKKCTCGKCEGVRVERSGDGWKRILSLEREWALGEDARGSIHLLRFSTAPRRSLISSVSQGISAAWSTLNQLRSSRSAEEALARDADTEDNESRKSGPFENSSITCRCPVCVEREALSREPSSDDQDFVSSRNSQSLRLDDAETSIAWTCSFESVCVVDSSCWQSQLRRQLGSEGSLSSSFQTAALHICDIFASSFGDGLWVVTAVTCQGSRICFSAKCKGEDPLSADTFLRLLSVSPSPNALCVSSAAVSSIASVSSASSSLCVVENASISPKDTREGLAASSASLWRRLADNVPQVFSFGGGSAAVSTKVSPVSQVSFAANAADRNDCCPEASSCVCFHKNGLFVFAAETGESSAASETSFETLLSLRVSTPWKARRDGATLSHFHCACALTLPSPLLGAVEDEEVWWLLDRTSRSSNVDSFEALANRQIEGLPHGLSKPLSSEQRECLANGLGLERRVWLFTLKEFLLISVRVASPATQMKGEPGFLTARDVGEGLALRRVAEEEHWKNIARAALSRVQQRGSRRLLHRMREEADLSALVKRLAFQEMKLLAPLPLPPPLPRNQVRCYWTRFFELLKVKPTFTGGETGLPRASLLPHDAEEKENPWLTAFELRVALVLHASLARPVFAETPPQGFAELKTTRQLRSSAGADGRETDLPSSAECLACTFPGPFLQRLATETDVLVSQVLLIVGPPSSTFAASLLHALKASPLPPWVSAADGNGSEEGFIGWRRFQSAPFEDKEKVMDLGDTTRDLDEKRKEQEDAFCRDAIAALAERLDKRGTLKTLLQAAPLDNPTYCRRLLRLIALVLMLLELRQVLRLLILMDGLSKSKARALWAMADALFQMQNVKTPSTSRVPLASFFRGLSLRQMLQCARTRRALTDLTTALVAVHGFSCGESDDNKPSCKTVADDVFTEVPWLACEMDCRMLFRRLALQFFESRKGDQCTDAQSGSGAALLQICRDASRFFSSSPQTQKLALLEECLFQLVLCDVHEGSAWGVAFATKQILLSAASSPAHSETLFETEALASSPESVASVFRSAVASAVRFIAEELARRSEGAEDALESPSDNQVEAWRRVLSVILDFECPSLPWCLSYPSFQIVQRSLEAKTGRRGESPRRLPTLFEAREETLLSAAEALQWSVLDCLFEWLEKQASKLRRAAESSLVSAIQHEGRSGLSEEGVDSSRWKTAFMRVDSLQCHGLSDLAGGEQLLHFKGFNVSSIFCAIQQQEASSEEEGFSPAALSCLLRYLESCVASGFVCQAGVLLRLHEAFSSSWFGLCEAKEAETNDALASFVRSLEACSFLVRLATDCRHFSRPSLPSAVRLELTRLSRSALCKVRTQMKERREGFSFEDAVSTSAIRSLFPTLLDRAPEKTELVEDVLFAVEEALAATEAALSQVQVPLTAFLCRSIVLKRMEGDEAASDCEEKSGPGGESPESQGRRQTLERLQTRLDSVRFSLLPLPALFDLAAAECFPLSLRPLLLDVSVHCTDATPRDNGVSEFRSDALSKRLKAAEFVHAATTAVLARLYIELLDPRATNAATEMLNATVDLAVSTRKEKVLDVVLDFCGTVWRDCLPGAKSEALAAELRNLDVLRPGNVYVLTALELLHGLYIKRPSPSPAIAAQPRNSEESADFQTLPPEVLCVAKSWAPKSQAQRLDVYLQLLGDVELQSRTCEFFNAQREAHASRWANAPLSTETPLASLPSPACPREFEWHLRRVILRSLLEWLAEAEREPSAMEAFDAALQADTLLGFLDSFADNGGEETEPEQQALREAARLVRALVLNVCGGVKRERESLQESRSQASPQTDSSWTQLFAFKERSQTRTSALATES